jgi:hypothetical protein
MNQVSKAGHDEVAVGEAAARELAALMEEFIALVREENAMLARGLPASLSSVSERKNELAGAFERWVKAAASRTLRLEAAPSPVRKQFLERLQLFQTTMNENVARLEAAIEASQWRIDAVMSAIRQEMVDATPYGSNGKVRSVANRSATRPGFTI